MSEDLGATVLELRAIIDSLDEQIFALIVQRIQIAEQIFQLKLKAGHDFASAQRQTAVLKHAQVLTNEALTKFQNLRDSDFEEQIEAIFQKLMQLTRSCVERAS